MSGIEVRNNSVEHRYEALVDGEVAGVATYDLTDSSITFLHTEVADQYGGRGVGSALARGALDDVRAAGGREVVPLCPFFKGWLDKHPDYQGLVRAQS